MSSIIMSATWEATMRPRVRLRSAVAGRAPPFRLQVPDGIDARGAQRRREAERDARPARPPPG